MSKHDIVYGIHAVLSALERDPGRVREVWVVAERDDRRLQKVLTLAQGAGVRIERTSAKDLDHRTHGARHQGVMAQIQATLARDDTWLEQQLTKLTVPAFLLILDGVQDPHNLGACLRTADAAGIHAVVAPRAKAVGLTAAVRKVASGAAETVPFVQVANLARTLRTLKAAGVWLIGADGQAEQSIYEADLRGPIAIVLGAEGRGLRHLTRKECDFLVRIPMHGTVESLNVSVAAGITLFEAVRQRQTG